MAKKGSTKSSKKSNTVTTTTEVTVIPEQDKSHEVDEGQVLSPQQALFLQLYYDPKSPTWGNARGSAIAAGFSEEYANQITYRKPAWWVGMVRTQNLMDKIEQHFDEVLSLPNITQAMGAFGPLETKQVIIEETGEVYKSGKRKGQAKTKKKTIKVPIFIPNVAIIKAKSEVAKLAAPAHDPDRYGKKAGNNNKFVFNMAVVRERYKTS